MVLVLGAPPAGPPVAMVKECSARGFATTDRTTLAYELAREGHVVVEVSLRGGKMTGEAEAALVFASPQPGELIYPGEWILIPAQDGQPDPERIAAAVARVAGGIGGQSVMERKRTLSPFPQLNRGGEGPRS